MSSIHFHCELLKSHSICVQNLIKYFFPRGILNVHASLLPKYRGAAPIIHAIKNGDNITGVTIMKIQPKHFDIGEILHQKEISIDKNELMPTLHDRLATEGAQLLLNVVKNLSTYLKNIRQQDETQATYAPKIEEEFTHVRWNEMTSQQVFDLYRSLYSFKFITTFWHNEKIKIKELKILENESVKIDTKPGTIKYCREKRCLEITCSDGIAVQVYSLGIGKKSKISAHDFNNGFLKKKPPEERFFHSQIYS